MRFVKFDGWEDKSYTFAVDFIMQITPQGRYTIVELAGGQQMTLEIDYEYFISRIFSDLANEREYEIIEIEYTIPQPQAGGISPTDLIV